MKDIRRDYENYRTRETRYAVSNPCLDYDTNELILFTLPAGVYICKNLVDVVKADGVAGATIDIVAVPASPKPTFADIQAATTVIADEVAVDATGLKCCTTCECIKFEKEMIIATRNGDTAGDGTGAFSVTVKFLEYLKGSENGLLRIPMRQAEAIEA